ncbi:MAG: hypothetical protein WC869_06955 [Phycisphaerae bacterium]|jgi:hypothetical protein
MLSKVFQLGKALTRWLAHRPAVLLLTAGDEALASQPAPRFAAAWLELMIVSVLWGGMSMQLWSWTWGLFGDYSGIPLMPVAVVLAIGMLLVYRRAVAALAEALGGSGPGQAVATSVILLVLALALLGLKCWDPDWPQYWPRVWWWVRPQTMFRPLLLAPIWGGWAMLVTCQFRKPSQATEPAVAAFARGCSPLATTLSLAAVLSATIMYFNHWPWTQLGIPATAMLTAVGGGLALGARQGALTRKVLLANNLLTQIAFFLAYLAHR